MDKKVKERVFKLRKLTVDDLKKNIDKLKEELSQLRIAKVAGGTASKLTRIRVVRKAIAKHLTVINEKARQTVRDQYKKKQYKPKDLRVKKTKAIRNRLTKTQLKRKTLRMMKKLKNFPLRKYALRE
eukprot:TRINITY_DN807_c0_g1_i2.p4 TRINITY_DN807_c0_g1~~TRINITY_DN807_c0_g1_i2.p4  ORF type:complete len:127 (+),score=35.44 TRINITY_DN807_c0_g1_i2:171-551(+)